MGSSGVPVLESSPEPSCDLAVGLTSFGPAGECGTAPGGFTFIPTLSNWIKQMAAQMSSMSGRGGSK